MNAGNRTSPGTGKVLMLLLALFSAQGTSSRADNLEAQFSRFLSWWPGTYDNQAQVVAAPDTTTAMRLYLQPMSLPAFGDEVVYGEWQNLEKDGAVMRQRFYSFEIDNERQALRLNLHIFPLDPAFAEKTRGAHLDPSRVAGLTTEDMFPLPGCDVFFTWQGDHFAGAMDKGRCAFKAPGTDDDIYSWSQMRLTADSFEYLDGWFNPDGSVYRVLGENWTVFQRR